MAALAAALLAGCAHDSVRTAPGARAATRTQQMRPRLPAKAVAKPAAIRPAAIRPAATRPAVTKSTVAKSETSRSDPATPAPDAAVTGAVAPVPPSARAPIPLPDQALLERQAPPDCTLKTEPAGASPTEVRLRVLDHERRCYSHVESVVREKLGQLQDAVAVTIEALDARGGASAGGR